MEIKYARLWLKKFIKYNHKKFDKKTLNRKINWETVNLSHRVYKRHGIKGHNIRQKIRKTLRDYCKTELKKYSQGSKKPSLITRIFSYLKRAIGKRA